MDILQDFRVFGETLGVIAGILISIGIIFGVIFKAPEIVSKIKQTSSKITYFFTPSLIKEIRNTQVEWQKDYVKESLEKAAIIDNLSKSTVHQEEKLDKIVKAIWNGGSNGMVHQIARIAAKQNIDFESKKIPQFECDNEGINTAVNEAYRDLVQTSKLQDLKGGSWRGVAYGELLPKYVSDFVRVSKRCEQFFGEVDFQNPYTGEHRGRWLVHANSVPIGDTCTYFGRFILACDETAIDLVDEYGWDVPKKDLENSSLNPKDP